MKSQVRQAAEAHTTLSLFEAAANILEGSDIKGVRARRVANKAVTLLRREQQMLLRDFDKAVLLATTEGSDNG